MHYLETYIAKVAQSITEVEYVAAAEVANEAIWFDKLIIEMKLKHEVVNLHYDSPIALHLTSNQVINNKVKYINIMYQFIRHVV